MTGTWASYQGHPCAAVRFVRGRGSSANTCDVSIPVQSFPANFSWRAASEELARRPIPEVPDVSIGLGDEPRGSLQLTSGLSYEGTLVLAEEAGRVFSVPGMVVTRIELASADASGSPALVKLTLADERLFAPRGILSRWRWNQRLPDGSLSLDTATEEGAAYSLEQIAREIVGSCWRKPSLARAPDRWGSTTKGVAFPRFSGASQALEELVTVNAGELSLHLDGDRAIYDTGEGFVGWAPGGTGPNSQPFPAEVILDLDGEGHGHVEESTWPPEWIVVTGEERVATVALDSWEPVLLLQGEPFLLSEELVRYLTGGELVRTPGDPGVMETKVTGGRYGLDWLEKWIMLPNAQLGADGVSEDVLKIFSEQAWKLYRIPGAEKHSGGFYTGELGRNAHLLPMLDRAETVRGKRVSPTVFCSSWETKSREIGREELSGLAAAQSKIAAIREEVKRRIIRDQSTFVNPLETGNPQVFGRGNIPVLPDALTPDSLRQREALTLGHMIPSDVPLPPGIDPAALNAAMREYRRINKLREAGLEEAAGQYEAALGEKLKAQDALSYQDLVSTYEAAKQLVGWEKEAYESGDNPGEEFRRRFGERSAALLEDLSRKRRLARRQLESDREAGRPRGKLLSHRIQQNNRRGPDAGARVVASDLGVVRTSVRAGHVEAEDVGDPSLTRFVPRPVRVLFGARVRPRIDIPKGSPFRIESATAGELAGFSVVQQLSNAITGDIGVGDFVPAALGDAATTYAAAFRRTGRGQVEAVDLEGVPMDLAQPVRRPWRELVPIAGEGNKAALDAEALELARAMASPVDRVKSATYSLAGPWPVQCDGIVSAVQIVSESANGAICGFTTTVSVGGEATIQPSEGTAGNRRVPDYV